MRLKNPLCLVICLAMLGISGPGVTEAGQGNPTGRRAYRQFTEIEDDLILQLVGEQKNLGAPIDWTVISGALDGRTARQCRERYKNFLNPESPRNLSWTDEEIEFVRDRSGSPVRLLQMDLLRKFGISRPLGEIRRYTRAKRRPAPVRTQVVALPVSAVLPEVSHPFSFGFLPGFSLSQLIPLPPNSPTPPADAFTRSGESYLSSDPEQQASTPTEDPFDSDSYNSSY
ncbi:MAG: SANT/Myb domain-containing protein [Holosporales bacterium]|nr:SANT/Myb domain-containing protein [Holosporales bacterium]